MKLRFWGWLIVTCTVLLAVPAAAQLIAADNLAATAAEARARRVPVLIAFMQQSCPYCAVARRDYLTVLQNDPQWKHRVLIREIETDRSLELRDFSGIVTTHREFARAQKVRQVPTLIAFDADGKRVSPPIIGLLGDEFYRLYIEQAIEARITKMQRR